jgi:ABC-type protease/lipase transport system fused ATPase/permease subunit
MLITVWGNTKLDIMSASKGVRMSLGVVLVLAGSVFALQGAGIIGGSAVMSGKPEWIYIGGALAFIGVLLALWGRMRRADQSEQSIR